MKRYPGCKNSFSLWKEGIKNGIFIPQFHGREHLNVTAWMKSLQSCHWDTRISFNNGMWGIKTDPKNNIGVSFQAAFDLIDLNDLSNQETAIRQGLKIFFDLFGYKATHFVPPNGPFNRNLEKVASDSGIKFMSAAKVQKEPLGKGQTRKSYHWLGQKNKHGQRYITRNCFFEPSQEGRDWVSSCINDIRIAFNWHKPAVISSHRVNYIGAIDPVNREKGLKQLKTLLGEVVKNWPDVEFMDSNKLGTLLSSTT